MTKTSPLRRRMIEGMTVHNMSPATQISYSNYPRLCLGLYGVSRS